MRETKKKKKKKKERRRRKKEEIELIKGIASRNIHSVENESTVIPTQPMDRK